MCEAQGKKRIRAGEALLRAAEQNPQAYPAVSRMLRLRQYAQEHPEFVEELRAIWEPVRQSNEAIKAATLKLLEPTRAVSAASAPLQAVMATICEEYKAQLAAIWADIQKVEKVEFEELLDDIRQAEAQADKEWAAKFPCPRPKTVEDWQCLAARAGFGADFVLKGEWTPADVLPIVEGYFQNLQDQRSVAAKEPKRKAAGTAAAKPERVPEITPEIAKRLSGLPAKNIQYWRAKAYAWLFHNEDSPAAKEKIEELTGLQFKNPSSIRKLRKEVKDFLKQAPADLPDKQQADVAKAMKYLRELYVKSHGSLTERQWRELEEDASQAMVLALLDEDFDGNPKSAAQKVIDRFRLDRRKHDKKVDPNTRQRYSEDERNA
jgi:hypothetical protein